MVSSSRRGASAVSDDDDESHSETWCPDWAHSSDEPSDNEPQHKNPDIEPDCVTEAEGEYSSSGAGTHGRGVPVMPVNPTGQVVVIGGMLPQHKDVVIKLPWNSIIVGHSFPCPAVEVRRQARRLFEKHAGQTLACHEADGCSSVVVVHPDGVSRLAAVEMASCGRPTAPGGGAVILHGDGRVYKTNGGHLVAQDCIVGCGPRGLAGPDRTHGIQDGGVWLPAAIPDGSTIAERA